MAGKPKICIVQADDEEIVKKIAEQQPQDKSKLKLPQDADRLVIMSTLPQVLSNLDIINLPRPNIPYYEMYKSEGMTQCYNLKYTPVALSEGMADIRTKEQEMEASPLIQAFVTIVKDNRSKEKVLDLFSLTPLLNGKVMI
ncbi:hypothetical protein DPMN_182519 [Dreissena polymorpha]|uniref:Uncharacterized protein n=1 Tax=Dreissena polymorpha TaxID=45954 RepID=A0A9D4DEC6_DREPO|nr:hypothetical protein DPMN_182519 [Dreissena polymorpha]